MARASQAALTVQAVVFGFDPDPGTPSNRTLQVRTVRSGVPTADVERGETCAEATTRRRAADAAAVQVASLVRALEQAGGRLGGLKARVDGVGEVQIRAAPVEEAGSGRIGAGTQVAILAKPVKDPVDDPFVRMWAAGDRGIVEAPPESP